MSVKLLELAGRRYVVLLEKDYRRLRQRARRAASGSASPMTDVEDILQAVEDAQAALARKVVGARHGRGMTQVALSRRAGIRPETLNRIERGKTAPDTATIVKIQRALKST